MVDTGEFFHKAIVETVRKVAFWDPQESFMASNLAKIQHIVVVMLENRSFDNMLGFLYADQGNVPPLNLPSQAPASFDGLLSAASSDAFWNPANAAFFSVPGTAPDKVFASLGTT